MANLIERIRRLEARALLHANEALTESERASLDRWPEILLHRYCEGRMDALAAELGPVRKLLAGLAEHGYAVQQSESWHPLYAVDDERLNEVVRKRLNAADVEWPSCA